MQRPDNLKVGGNLPDKVYKALEEIEVRGYENITYQSGRTLLHYAGASGHCELATYLLSVRADATARDDLGKTPLMLADERCNAAVAHFLRNHPPACRDSVEDVRPEALTDVAKPASSQLPTVAGATTVSEDNVSTFSSFEGCLYRFDVNVVKKAPGDAVGMQVDVQSETSLEIVTIKEGGLVEKHNSKAPPDCQVRPGHFITRVNKVTGGVKEMAAELSRLQATLIEVAPIATFIAVIEKGKSSLGVVLDWPEAKGEAARAEEEDGRTKLEIKEVKPGGAVATYNKKAREGEQIQKGDRIKEVLGVTGKPQDMIKFMQDEDTVCLVVKRPMPQAM